MTRDGSDVRYVFDFSHAGHSGPELLGGKGAGLVRLVGLGLPVPPGFVVSCEAGRDYLRDGAVPRSALDQVSEHLSVLESQVRREFGDEVRPLLVSVRSGAPISMPGMMDTVLNVGLTDRTVQALADETSNEPFAWSCYARLLESYARIVREVPSDDIEGALLDVEMSGAGGVERARATVAAMQQVMLHHGGPLPQDPREQVGETIEAVFRSWTSPRAQAYRAFRGIANDLGTAAVVQAMVFGNRGTRSGSGVVFTRDPSTGDRGLFGDFLFDAQGEDVVDGSRDPSPLADLGDVLPEALEALSEDLTLIENDARDLCEVEFTVEEGQLWILQTRAGQRSPAAAVRTAVALVDEGLIDRAEALARVSPAQAEAVSAPAFAREPANDEILMRGLAASPGAAIGRLVFETDRAVELEEQGIPVILLRPTTSPSDVAGFIAARGVVTGRGGRTSHAAVVARGMGRPAVCGVGSVSVAGDGRTATVNGVPMADGTVVSLDGERGFVADGELPLGPKAGDPALARLLEWGAEAVSVPLLNGPESRDGTATLVLDDPEEMSPAAANVALAEANSAGQAPVILLSSRWAARAQHGLKGFVSGIALRDAVSSWTLVARELRPRDDLGGPSGGETRPEPG
jgi:pyruvate,orthophosphate dikinase